MGVRQPLWSYAPTENINAYNINTYYKGGIISLRYRLWCRSCHCVKYRLARQ